MIMQRFFVLLLVLMFSSCTETAVDIPQRNKDIGKVLAKQLKAWNSGNINGFMQGYKAGNGTTFITSKSLYFHRDTLEEMYNKSYGTPDKMGHLSFDIDTIKSFASTHKMALVIGKWKVKTANDSNTHSGRFSLVFEKNIDWEITVDQTW